MLFDYLCKFLQYDITRLFRWGAEACEYYENSPNYTASVEGRINNVYSPRPRITDGEEDWKAMLDAEKKYWDAYEDEMQCDGDERGYSDGKEDDEDEDCKDEEFAFEDLTDCDAEDVKDGIKVETDNCNSSNIKNALENSKPSNAIKKEVTLGDLKTELAEQATAPSKKRTNPCELVCKQVAEQVVQKCSASTQLEMDAIEKRAADLFSALHATIIDDVNNYSNWFDLKSWQKLPFYWAVLTNEELSDNPCENFKRFYAANCPTPKRKSKRQVDSAVNLWQRLKTKQRLPFIMEAFVAKVSKGDVDIHDERDIKRIINELHHEG